MAGWSLFWFALFLAFAAYGFSGARLIRPLPLLKGALVTIAVVYAVRGLAIIPQIVWFADFPVTRGRDVAFSGVSVLLAVCYAAAARHAFRKAAA